METIELPAGRVRIPTSGGNAITNLATSHLWGDDGDIKALWPDRPALHDMDSLVIAGLPTEYRYVYRGAAGGSAELDRAVRTGRYDLLYSSWHPLVLGWSGDMLIRVDSSTIGDASASIPGRRVLLRSPDGQLYLYSRAADRAEGRDEGRAEAAHDVEPATVANPAAAAIALVKKIYGEPSSSSSDYLLSQVQVINSDTEEVRSPPTPA